MKKIFIGIIAVVLAVVGVFLYGLWQPVEEVPGIEIVEEVPEIEIAVDVVEPRLRDASAPLLPPPGEPTRDQVERSRRLVSPPDGVEVFPAHTPFEPPEPPEPRQAEPIEPFDHDEHMQAMADLAPVHHARMAEARLAAEAVSAYEEALFEEPRFQDQVAAIESLRERIEAAEEDQREALKEELSAMEASLRGMLQEDTKWVELQQEAESADQRRENVRQKIVTRIQNRMRHDFAVKRAEREDALAALDNDDN